MKTLKELQEARDGLLARFEELTRRFIDGEELTEEETSERDSLKGELRTMDARIGELRELEERKAAFDAAREEAGTAEAHREAAADAKVTDEPVVYGKGSPNSYFADLVRSSSPFWKGHQEALQRLSQYEYQVSVEIARGTEDGKRAEALVKESRRDESGRGARDLIETLRSRGNAGSESGLESRAMSAGASSGGSFVTPIYFIQEWAPYRKPGRAFVDQTNKQDLPEYGMAIYIPAVQSDAAVAAQETAPGTNENTAVVETDPSAGYLSTNLQTLAGQITVSQQLLDRAGPNFAFDRLIFDQLTRDYNAAVDAFVLQRALATAGTIAYNGSAFVVASGTQGAGSFYQKVSGAKSVIRTAAGVVMDPTHLFLTPSRWEYIAAQSDTTGRPLVVPGYANPYNAAAAGNQSGDPGYEGSTGYRFNGLDVYHDLNIPNPGVGADQAIVGALDEVYTWEGNLVPRVIPQTYAQNLSVLLQLYAYVGVIVRYPNAVQTISGTSMATINF